MEVLNLRMLSMNRRLCNSLQLKKDINGLRAILHMLFPQLLGGLFASVMDLYMALDKDMNS